MMTDEVISVAKKLFAMPCPTRDSFAFALRLTECHSQQTFDQPKKSLDEITALVIESAKKMCDVGLPVDDALALAVRLLELDLFTKVANATG